MMSNDHDPISPEQRELAALRQRVAELETQLGAYQQAALDRAQADARFVSLFRTSPVAVVISTLAEGRYVAVNQRFCDLTGYAAVDVVGRTSRDLNIWVQLEERAFVGAELRAGRVLRDMELTFRASDGRTLTVLASFAPIEFDGMACALTICQDITERQQLAHARDRLYAEAQAALRAREEFLSVTAHELKTPITSLQGFAQLLLRRLQSDRAPDPAMVQRGLSVIEYQAQKLLRLVDQLLDLSRIDERRLVLNYQPTDLVRLVQQTVALMQALTERHTIRAFLPAHCVAAVDPLRLEQVLTNLLDNAIKYSPEGSLVQVELTQPHEHLVRLSVADHGRGIAPEHQAQIFERFYRAERRDGGGMGLGLYISYHIVAMHGGSLSYEALPEGGSRFSVLLPITPPES
jgi:PAS domain S-box-containing protein